MTKDEALKLALDALHGLYDGQSNVARKAIKEALLQPAPVQEPVAYPEGDVVGPCICGSWPGGKCRKCPKQPAQQPVTHTINSTRSAAVATDHYWIPIDANTPRGVKLQLLGQGGVAQYSNYHGDSFWSHWAPLPKRRD